MLRTGGRALARLELAADDPVFDHAAQLDAERDGKIGIDVEGHGRRVAPRIVISDYNTDPASFKRWRVCSPFGQRCRSCGQAAREN